MLHGRIKETLTEKQRIAQQTKLNKFQSLLNLALFLGTYSPITSLHPELIPPSKTVTIHPLVHTSVLSKLSNINPDIPTIWNHRRRLLLHSTKHLAEPLQTSIFLKDLQFTLSVPHEKSYSLFWHMEWLISQTVLRKSIEASEMIVKRCSTLIWKDCRNFHAWDLLHAVNHIYSVSIKNQLEWANFMISRNMKNGSAWHFRYLCIRALHEKYPPINFFDRENIVIQHAKSVIPDNEAILNHSTKISNIFNPPPKKSRLKQHQTEPTQDQAQIQSSGSGKA